MFKSSLFIILAMMFISCKSVVLSNAGVFKVMPGLEGMPIEKKLKFQIETAHIATVDKNIIETTTNSVFTIYSVLNTKSELQNIEKELLPDTYNIIAEVNNDIELNSNLNFIITINNKKYILKPKLVENQLMK